MKIVIASSIFIEPTYILSIKKLGTDFFHGFKNYERVTNSKFSVSITDIDKSST